MSDSKVTQMLRFRFGFEKKIQAAAAVLRGRGHMDRLRLLKILYIADREALGERGVPILGGRAVAMDHGPLHSDIYNMIKGEDEREAAWSKHIANDGHTVFLKDDPGRLDLSPYEIEKLDSVATRMDQFETMDIRDGTHAFEEWKKFYEEGTSHTIPVESILEAQGWDAKDIQSLVDDADAHSSIRRHLVDTECP